MHQAQRHQRRNRDQQIKASTVLYPRSTDVSPRELVTAAKVGAAATAVGTVRSGEHVLRVVNDRPTNPPMPAKQQVAE